MSDQPWANEPTPITSKAIKDAVGSWTFPLRDRFENVERRMRAAERLLESAWKQNSNASTWEELDYQIIKHLEAARKEDGQ